MRTANPVLRNQLLQQRAWSGAFAGPPLELAGVVHKALVLAVLVALGFCAPWQRLFVQPIGAEALAAAGMGVGMVFSVITWLRRDWAGCTAPVVALCVGLLLGGMSAYLHREVGGLFGVALIGSPAAFVVLLWLYRHHLIEPGERLRASLNVVTGALFLTYLATVVLHPYAQLDVPLLVSQPAGIAFCVLVVSMAALNLVLDVEVIAEAADEGAPAVLEWYAAFSLLISLVWAYPETIRMVTRLHARLSRGHGVEPTSVSQAPGRR